MSDVVDRLWGFCHTLRHDGIDYGDYIEQITYLLFLKMAEERDVELPEDVDWDSLRQRSGLELTDHYVDMLRILGREHGILGDIFSGAQSRFSNPVNLKKLVSLIDETRWTELGVDVKAAAFEGLLEKAASEGKKGAGQYFTPRILIDTITRCIQPDPRKSADFKICDPACGTGGFLVSAYEWFVAQTRGGALDRSLVRRIQHETYYGQDLVPRPRRLALMNLYLHGLEPTIWLGDSIYDPPTSDRFDVILTNPPFGTRGANQAPDRDDFTIATSNKQLNFLQHVLTVMKPGARAAVVVPDNCLFADQAGEVFRILTEDCDLHTVLRLPRGTFTPYSPGTKTNVIFFTKGRPTERIWIYDARANVPTITKKDRPLTREHFGEFEQCFGDDPFGSAHRSEADSPSGRWRAFSIAEVVNRGFKLDSLRWIRDAEEDERAPGDPTELISETVASLDVAVRQLQQLGALLEEDADSIETDVDEMPAGWTTATVGDLATGPNDISYGVLKPGVRQVQGGVPMLRVKDVTDGRIDESDLYCITGELAEEYRRTTLKGGEVLISVQGSVGRVAIVPDHLAGANVSRTLAVIPPAKAELGEWLWLVLQSPLAQSAMRDVVTGSTRDSLNLRDLRKVEIPVPPEPEQARILERVNELFALTDSVEKALALASGLKGSDFDLDQLRRAILHRAVTGRLVATEASCAEAEAREFQSGADLVAAIAGTRGTTRTRVRRRLAPAR